MLRGRLELGEKFCFKLTADELKNLVEYADQHNSAVSWAVRELIKKGLAAEGQQAADHQKQQRPPAKRAVARRAKDQPGNRTRKPEWKTKQHKET